MGKREDVEYAVFAVNKRTGKEEQIGRAVESEMLCRNRFREYVENGWLNSDYDAERAVIKKRTVVEITGDWEVAENAGC